MFDSPPNSEFFQQYVGTSIWGSRKIVRNLFSKLFPFKQAASSPIFGQMLANWPVDKSISCEFLLDEIETGYKELTNQATSPTDLQFCSKAMWHLFALLSCVAWGAHWLDDQGWRFVAKVYLVVVVSLKAIWQCFQTNHCCHAPVELWMTNFVDQSIYQVRPQHPSLASSMKMSVTSSELEARCLEKWSLMVGAKDDWKKFSECLNGVS